MRHDGAPPRCSYRRESRQVLRGIWKARCAEKEGSVDIQRFSTRSLRVGSESVLKGMDADSSLDELGVLSVLWDRRYCDWCIS